MNTSEIAVKTGDDVEIVLRARVSAVQALDDGVTVLYFEMVDGDEKLGYVPPVYLGSKSAVQSLTTIEPKLDLDALPYDTVVEAMDADGTTRGIFRKCQDSPNQWAALDGNDYPNSDLYQYDELIELVRRDTTA